MAWSRFWRRASPTPSPGQPDQPDPYLNARRRMVRDQIAARGVSDPEVLAALERVPRHAFVDSAYAYEDRALPLAEGQTISQPFVVALMTQAARPAGGWRGARVLEVGTGSGYQAAVLAELGAAVTTIERHPELSAEAATNLTAAGYGGVRCVVGDGSAGYPAQAPYDAIVVTAAGPSVPQPLREQLSPDDGRLVMPVGGPEHQWVTLVQRHGDEWVDRRLEPVVFVPLVGDFGVRERS